MPLASTARRRRGSVTRASAMPVVNEITVEPAMSAGNQSFA